MQSTSLPCPNCQQPFRLTVDYLQRHGGRVTTCPSCQQRFTLPTTEEVFSAAPSTPTETHASQTSPVLFYESSAPTSQAVAAPAGGIWRDGWYAYVNRGALLPEFCFRCGDTSDLSTVEFELKHVRGRGAGYVGGSADHYFHGEAMLVRCHACPKHRSGVAVERRVANGLLILGIISFVAAPVLLMKGYVLTGIACLMIPGPLLFVARLIMAASPTGLTATRIDRHGAYVSGFGRNFLMKLKPLSQAKREHQESVSNALDSTYD